MKVERGRRKRDRASKAVFCARCCHSGELAVSMMGCWQSGEGAEAGDVRLDQREIKRRDCEQGDNAMAMVKRCSWRTDERSNGIVQVREGIGEIQTDRECI